MPKDEAVYRIDSLEDLAKLFDGFARTGAGNADWSRLDPKGRRAAVQAFKLAASITRRTIMGKQDAKG